MTIFLRLIFGVVLAGAVSLWVHLGFPGDLIFILGVGTVAAIWGDKFILGFMSLMRYLR